MRVTNYLQGLERKTYLPIDYGKMKIRPETLIVNI